MTFYIELSPKQKGVPTNWKQIDGPFSTRESAIVRLAACSSLIQERRLPVKLRIVER